jgi:hypothetical protein
LNNIWRPCDRGNRILAWEFGGNKWNLDSDDYPSLESLQSGEAYMTGGWRGSSELTLAVLPEVAAGRGL